MLATHLGRTDQTKSEGSGSAKSVRLGIVLGELVLASVAVNGVTILADSKARQPASTDQPVSTETCTAIVRAADRLACYDTLAHRPAEQPARGANATY